jgi:hypothetical protein
MARRFFTDGLQAKYGCGLSPATCLAQVAGKMSMTSTSQDGLRNNPAIENFFALVIPDNVGQVGVTGDDLCCYTT